VYIIIGKEIEQVEGELTEITPEMQRRIRIQKAREVAEAKTKEDLERIAEQRGYKKGWVFHVLKQRKNEVTSNI
jgi:DNA polymerase III delta prime subunit